MESKADTIERLRRRMSEIPARSAGSSRPPLESLAGDRRTDDEPRSRPPSALRTLPTPGPLADLLPHGGLVRGTTVQVSGSASLRAGLIAAVTGSGGWAAIVGSPNFGLLAAAEMGADLQRCALIPDPGADPVAVGAVLVDGIDLVLLSLGGADIPPTRARAVTARARRNGTVLAVTDGRWPTVDVQLDARVAGYRGLDTAAHRITGIDLTLDVHARGHQPRRATVEVTGRAGAVSWSARAAEPAALRVAQ